MYLPEALGGRRVCYLAGRPFWVRPIDLGGIADVLAWLDDMIPGERDGPPDIGSPEGRQALDTPAGEAMLAWIGLRGQGVSYEDAADLWRRADDAERSRFLRVLFRRRKTLRREGDGGEDIARTWCGDGLAQMVTDMGVDAFRTLTLDQLDWLGSGGKCDGHADPGAKALAQTQAMWLKQQAEREAGVANGEAHGG